MIVTLPNLQLVVDLENCTDKEFNYLTEYLNKFGWKFCLDSKPVNKETI